MDAMQISLAPSVRVHLWQRLLGWNEDKKIKRAAVLIQFQNYFQGNDNWRKKSLNLVWVLELLSK